MRGEWRLSSARRHELQDKGCHSRLRLSPALPDHLRRVQGSAVCGATSMCPTLTLLARGPGQDVRAPGPPERRPVRYPLGGLTLSDGSRWPSVRPESQGCGTPSPRRRLQAHRVHPVGLVKHLGEVEQGKGAHEVVVEVDAVGGLQRLGAEIRQVLPVATDTTVADSYPSSDLDAARSVGVRKGPGERRPTRGGTALHSRVTVLAIRCRERGRRACNGDATGPWRYLGRQSAASSREPMARGASPRWRVARRRRIVGRLNHRRLGRTGLGVSEVEPRHRAFGRAG